MKHYKTIGLLFVFALMMLVNGAAAQTSNDNGPKPATAMVQDIPSPAAALFTSTQSSTTNPFQIGHKYMVTSSQNSKVGYVLVDAVKGDWIQIKVFENAGSNKPTFGSGMWFNTAFLTSASEVNQ
jgi:hypothetical protein